MESMTATIPAISMTASVITPKSGSVLPGLRSRYVNGEMGRENDRRRCPGGAVRLIPPVPQEHFVSDGLAGHQPETQHVASR